MEYSHGYFITAAVLLLVGLAICWLSGSAKYPLLVTIFFWVGLLIAIVGGLLIFGAICIYIATHLRAAMGV